MGFSLTFLGGTGTVTGSKYLIEAHDKRILVDCGLFQGFKQLRLKNWSPLPVAPATIDAVVLTHAHLDHSGYIPLLVRNGFKGPVYSTPATRDFCSILLPDSGHLQERDAEFANKHGFSKHRPARPLYTQRDAEACLESFKPAKFGEDIAISHDITARFRPAGHILGAATVQLTIGGTSILFSGDLGPPNSATMLDPAPVRHTDYLVVESTYGNRIHDKEDPEDQLAEVITRTAAHGGTVLIPAFAVGRAQTILFHLDRLKQENRIPDLPVFLDSPMAIDAGEIFCAHLGDHRLTEDQCRTSCGVAEYVREAEKSKALDANKMPKVIISASGMATGGRILHHLKYYAVDERNALVFTGFQAGGTRGSAIVGGAQAVKIHGAYVNIRAEVHNLHMLSAHADAEQILDWVKNIETPPRRTFVTHGEPFASDALRRRISEELGWDCIAPAMNDRADLE
ncbi:MBL fold metallo-hydrolase RNA specificity domain-containing protein [Marinicaulis aureus]|uniref:MBL fold metallo-hydrolase RNA specificity domain-containing protein n=1 Tax=Hyphococcus aureus TaxID=2666033 RepID=A0ABW1KZV5_9PROT